MKTIIIGEEFENEQDNLIKDNKTLWLGVIVNYILFAFLLMQYFSLTDKMHLSVDIPSNTYGLSGVADVTAHDANDFYFKVHGMFLIKENADFSAENIKNKHGNIQKMMTPSVYGYTLKDFKEKESLTIVNKIIRATKDIEPPVVERNGRYARVTIEMEAQHYINGAKMEPIQCKYEIVLYRNNWNLYVKSYNDNCYSSFKAIDEKEKK